MTSCTKCGEHQPVLKAGFIRGRQRYFCKACEYHFTEPNQVSNHSRRRRQSTIGDVARQVGVSLSTVSRALNDHSDISPTTRQAILEAALSLDYQPNLMAQGLKNQATSTIGVIVPDIERPFFATVVSGVQQIAMAAGYRVMICQSKESHQAEVSNVQALIGSRVDGLLICHSRETENFEHIKYAMRRNIPVVHFDRVCNEVNSAKVILDDRLGAYNVTEHLIEQGCRRIAILAGPEALLISRQRQAGYLSALRRHGLPIQDKLQVHIDFQPASVEASLDAWLALPEPPDAIFAINYTNAFDLILGIKKRGLRVPEDIAIAGFGDEFLAHLVEPSLTTVNLHPYQIGQQAASLFLEQIAQREDFVPRTCTIAGTLMIRQSSMKGQSKCSDVSTQPYAA